VVFEDELVAKFARKPLFRQRLYLISREPLLNKAASVSLNQLAKLPLILPGLPNVVRNMLDRAFTAADVTPIVVAEADVLSTILSAVRTGIGNAIIPKGDLADISGEDLAQPILIEPPIYLTASIISSSDYPLTNAGEAVRTILAQFIDGNLRKSAMPGIEWIGDKTAISTTDTRISK